MESTVFWAFSHNRHYSTSNACRLIVFCFRSHRCFVLFSVGPPCLYLVTEFQMARFMARSKILSEIFTSFLFSKLKFNGKKWPETSTFPKNDSQESVFSPRSPHKQIGHFNGLFLSVWQIVQRSQLRFMLRHRNI